MVPDEFDDMAIHIWTANERISHALRNMVIREMVSRKRNEFSESLSSKQNHMVIAVRSLCEDHPQGVSLKLLARHLNVTPSSASVMVEALNSGGYLERDVAAEDRRKVRIRLSPQAERFYDEADRIIQAKLRSLADQLGDDLLPQWSALLRRVEKVLLMSEDDAD